MKNTGVILLVVLLLLLPASGCVSPVTRTGRGPVEVRYALDPQSMTYNPASGMWNVTFNMTVTLTNGNTYNDAAIPSVDVAIWPSFEKGHQQFGTIFEHIGIDETLGPGQSVTKQKTFFHTFTDAELSAFEDRDYDIIITVPGYTTSAGSMMERAGITRTTLQRTPAIPTPGTATPRPVQTVPAAPALPASPHVPGGLLVWYDFEGDFASSGRVQDRSGNGNDALLQGGLKPVPGIAGSRAARFDGNSYIRTGKNPAAGRDNVTFSFWFKTDDPTRNFKMASAAWWRGGPGSGWTMATHIPEFWAEDTKGVCMSDITNLDNGFLPGQWNFEVVTYDGRVIREYTNGKLINTWQTRGVPLGTGSPMAIGGWPEVGFFYTGDLDEFIIYDHALTGGEIATLYTA